MMELFYIRHKTKDVYYKGGCFNSWVNTTKNQKPLTLKQVQNFYKYAVRKGIVKMWYNPYNNTVICREDEFEVIDVFTNQVVDYKKFK